MKVAIIAPEDLPIPPRRGGSVQIYLQSLCQALQSNPSVQLTLLSPGGKAKLGGINHVTLHGSKAAYQRQVIQHLHGMRPDIIQVENRPNLVHRLKSQFPNSRVILNLHSLTFLGPMHIPAQRARDVLCSTDVVVNSRYLKRTIEARFRLPSSSQLQVIYPGVDIRAYASFPYVSSTSSPLRLIYVGRVIRQKGVHVLLQALRQLRSRGVPVFLTIVGRTPPWETSYAVALRKMSHGLPLVWKGFVEPKRLPALLAKSHILVCPSQHTEAFGLVNVEAMAAGAAVVASSVGGIPEIVTKDSGRLVSAPRSPHAFAEAILHLARHRKRLAQLREGAKKRALDFTWNRAARQFVQIYQEEI